MRSLAISLVLTCWVGFVAQGAELQARIIKVLPHYLDLEGRHTLSPSLYERDAYQAMLRRSPEKCSGIRFDVEWKAKGYPADKLKMKVEIRANKESGTKTFRLEQAVQPKGFLGYWAGITWAGEEFKTGGNLSAWRVTLWSGDQQIAEQKSFLW